MYRGEEDLPDKQVIYEAELKYEEPHHSIPNQSAPVTKKYIGTVKEQFPGEVQPSQMVLF